LDFKDLVRKRRSIHYYTDEPVTQEAINYIIDAARWAPSAGNSQPTRFIIVKDEHIKEKIWESTKNLENISPQNFIKKAPINIVVVTDKTAYKGKQAELRSDLFSIQDSSAAIMNLLLAAADLGMGACWVGLFREDKLREVFNLPSNLLPVAIVPFGHTNSKEKPRKRKTVEELLYVNSLKENLN
jgi:nitroreductase